MTIKLACFVAIFPLLALITTAAYTQTKSNKTVVFICEHGSAKSVVAAAHFNRIAQENGIDVKAISRGTNPDPAIPDKINKLLNSDGFASNTANPIQLTSDDLRTADYVVAFSPIAESYGSKQKIESWTIPSFESGYSAARDSIIHNIERLIRRVKSETQK